jgi:hypothetical protein
MQAVVEILEHLVLLHHPIYDLSANGNISDNEEYYIEDNILPSYYELIHSSLIPATSSLATHVMDENDQNHP